MGKKASQAGHECRPSSSGMILRSEDTLEEEPDERERFEVCEIWKRCQLALLRFVGKKKYHG